MVQRLNSDLANNLGNLAQRSLSMIAKHCDGRVPEAAGTTTPEVALLQEAYALPPRLTPLMETQQFHTALERIFHVCALANQYIDAQAPWTLRKTDPARMATVLWAVAECLRPVAICLQPWMPDSMGRLLDLLGVPADARTLQDARPAHALRGGTSLPAPSPVFPRFGEG
jgi:Methionyl-tRNA synthetase